mgnify:CR=1 FL=1
MLSLSQSSAALQNVSQCHCHLIMIQHHSNIVFSPVNNQLPVIASIQPSPNTINRQRPGRPFHKLSATRRCVGTPHHPRLPQTTIRLNANRLLPPNQGNCRFRSRRLEDHKPGCRLRHLGKVAEDMWSISAVVGTTLMSVRNDRLTECQSWQLSATRL